MSSIDFMIQTTNLSKSFGGRLLFEDLTFSVGPREVIGLVGRNGCGKSTLTKIILGLESQDEGTVSIPKGYRLGHLDQHIRFSKKNVVDEVASALPKDQQMMTYKAEKILFGLGFSKKDLEKAPEDFSGGYQLRINLAKCLINEPDLLILDEPTNYLDILSINWMKGVLQNYPGEVLLITHDKSFMDSVITHTAGIHRGVLKKIKGKTHKYYEQLSQDEEIYLKTRDNQIKKKKDLEKFVEKFRAKASKATQAQSKMKQIEKLDIGDDLQAEQNLGFRFSYASTHAKTLAKVSNLSFGFEENKLLFKDLSFEVKVKDRIAVIGKNGKGKTTLLNVIDGALKPKTGSTEFHPSTKIGYYQQTNRKDLSPELTIIDEIGSENPNLGLSEIRGICGAMMFSGDAAKKKIKVLSGGEQSRVLLGKVLAHPTNFLLLDEPTNHLDIESIDALISEVKKFEGPVLFVTHNEEFLRQVANKLIVFKKGKAHIFNGNYKEFLEKEGWDDEENRQNAKDNTSNSEAKVDFERQKKISKLEKRIDSLGEKVMSLEEQIKMEESSLKNDWEADKPIYEKIKQLKNKIDKNYAQIEDLMIEIEKLG
jgi:ATP-binding cassette subfamily F protein 3